MKIWKNGLRRIELRKEVLEIVLSEVMAFLELSWTVQANTYHHQN